jgi:hypothetical protein
MIKKKTLSAVIVLSAAVATPVLAQDAGVRGPGSRIGLQSQPGSRGAYNRLNGPFHATPRTRDGWNIENYFGFNGRDPSIPGGEDPSLNPASS